MYSTSFIFKWSNSLQENKMSANPIKTTHAEPRYISWNINFIYAVCMKRGDLFKQKWLNLGVSGGFAHYWYNLRTKQIVYFEWQQGGNSIMVWAANSFNGPCDLVEITHYVNSEDYCTDPDQNLKDFVEEVGENLFFRTVMQRVMEVTISQTDWRKWYIFTFNWPYKSNDSIAIENLSAILARNIYKNQNQYSTLDELKTCILEFWIRIQTSVLSSLYCSIQKRFVSVIKISRLVAVRLTCCVSIYDNRNNCVGLKRFCAKVCSYFTVHIVLCCRSLLRNR